MDELTKSLLMLIEIGATLAFMILTVVFLILVASDLLALIAA